MPKREAIFPANRHTLYDEHRYSAAIRSGDLLFVSGQVGSRDDGSPEPVFEDQVRRAFANLGTGGRADDDPPPAEHHWISNAAEDAVVPLSWFNDIRIVW